MFTSTLSLPFSTLISVTLPWKSGNGPSMTRTFSPTSYSTLTLVGASALTCFWMPLISCSCNGTGLLPEPTKEVTPGVLRTTYHDSSDTVSYTHLRAHETRHDL